MASIAVAIMLTAAANAASSWVQQGPTVSGIFGGVAALSSTTAIITGGINNGKEGEGAFLLDTQTHTLNQTFAAQGGGMSMILAVAMSVNTPNHGVAVGPALLGSAVAYVTTDAGKTWSPSKDVAKGFAGAVAGSDIHGVPDGSGSDTFAYVTEYNSYTNGSKCSHDDSPQCSGVFLSKDGGMTFEHIDWHGTDGPDTDAKFGAFPSSKTWFISGGLVQPGSEAGPHYKATVTKTVDGGRTFSTVFNVTASAANPGEGVGGMGPIACADEATCFATSNCDDPQCGPNLNKTRGHGTYFHYTSDGGSTWKELFFDYEKSTTAIRVLSKTEVWIGGGSSGEFGKASAWHTTDAGKSWARTDFGSGTVMGMDFLSDGSVGYATTCSVASTCAVWSLSL